MHGRVDTQNLVQRLCCPLERAPIVLRTIVAIRGSHYVTITVSSPGGNRTAWLPTRGAVCRIVPTRETTRVHVAVKRLGKIVEA